MSTPSSAPSTPVLNTDYANYRVIRRDGRETSFKPEKITKAIGKAFVEHEETGELSQRSKDVIRNVTDNVVESLLKRRSDGGIFHIEEIQDQVELELMRAGEYKVAKGYVLYREKRNQERKRAQETPAKSTFPRVNVKGSDGKLAPLDVDALHTEIEIACAGLEHVNSSGILDEVLVGLYDGITQREVRELSIMAAKAKIERAPENTYVAARLLLNIIASEAFNRDISHEVGKNIYAQGFKDYISTGIQEELLAPVLQEYDLDKIAAALKPQRDLKFTYLGLQTLYDRYFIHIKSRRIELPQWFWMRVAMGLAQNETNKEEKAIEFYNIISMFRFVPSTPTLFNSGTNFPQLSSCYLTTVGDDLSEIFDAYRDNALLSKFSGGLGNDWTNVRALGAHIKSTNGKSTGLIPFLKVADSATIAVTQGGKRRGAACAYLEPWHLDIEDFLDLRKNTGDDRRRTHDMHIAVWTPDLFLQRVKEKGNWTLFSPDDVPDLHDLYGREFNERYAYYESQVADGKITHVRTVPAVDLWRKILTRLFETGHPWFCYKDPSNLRSPQRHKGVVHSSNLCTEIILNTNEEEIAVCNLGSVNIAAHTTADGINQAMLKDTVATAMRMLDNVIDINLYPVPEAKTANMRHRPVGLGLMGFQDALYKQRIPYSSPEAVDFADRSMEMISYHAIAASTELAKERGTYSSFEGSLWDQGILPIDSIKFVDEARQEPVDVARGTSLDWEPVREAIRKHGMRNSNCMAIAPTATISNISGVTQSIEPEFANLFVKSNLSGEFTVINSYLVEDLRELGLWDANMIDDLKYFDGVLAEIDRIPDDLKQLYATAFEVEPTWLIQAGARRQKWIDMSQSINLYMANPTGRKISEMYMEAWRRGLKTTYYLRSKAATQVEKSTLDINRKSIQPRWMKSESPSARMVHVDRAEEISNGNSPNGNGTNSADEIIAAPPESAAEEAENKPLVCSMEPDCESCQ